MDLKRLMYALPLVLFMVIGVYFAIGLTKDPQKLPSVLINQLIPEFSLDPIKGRGIDGQDRGLSSSGLKGQVSLVNFFGSWCIACKVEHPFLMKIKEENLVPLHGVDWREANSDDGPNWLKEYGDPYTLIGDDPKSKAAIAFGVYGAPETFIIGANGVIRHKFVGPMNQKDWDEVLWPIIQKLRQELPKP